MWMKNEHSQMNFIHDNVGDNANASVGHDVDDDGGYDVNELLQEIIYDNTF
jgi:hypothetical protein